MEIRVCDAFCHMEEVEIDGNVEERQKAPFMFTHKLK
jgi:hypothetical protein